VGGLTPIVRSATAWLTLRNGLTSTACRRTVPCEPIRVLSSRGPVLTIASTKTLKEESLVRLVIDSLNLYSSYLDGVLVGEEMNDLKRVCNNSDCH
jgi:hypothetical protein